MNALFYALLHELVKFQHEFYNSKRKNKASIKPTEGPSLKVFFSSCQQIKQKKLNTYAALYWSNFDALVC